MHSKAPEVSSDFYMVYCQKIETVLRGCIGINLYKRPDWIQQQDMRSFSSLQKAWWRNVLGALGLYLMRLPLRLMWLLSCRQHMDRSTRKACLPVCRRSREQLVEYILLLWQS